MPEETVAVPKMQMAEMLLALDAANREMNGTARLMGRQHQAIVEMSNVLRLIASREGDREMVRLLAVASLARWGTQEQEAT